MNEPELRERQAAIRDSQRDRIDTIHQAVHELLRDEERMFLGSLTEEDARCRRQAALEEMNRQLHNFMRDYDNAVMIHEATALLRGEDPSGVAGTLWPVRTERPAPETDDE